MNIADYTAYKAPFPVGVKLPEIKIEKKYYDEVGCSDLEDNFQFLRKLCFKKVKEKNIDEKDNAPLYYDRLKEELDIFNDLGFVDYVLLNWDIINFCIENGIPVGAGKRKCGRVFSFICHWGD
jgi:DNA polymerase III alpha subunit